MVIPEFHHLRSRILIVLFLLFNGFFNTACAIDNPDSIDFAGLFEQRELPYIAAINNPDNGTRDYLVAYNNYLQFLDKEMNDTLQQVKARLSDNQKHELVQSQHLWLKYRDAEFRLIQETWSRKNYGSSAGISRGDYKSSIVKKRVLQLQSYLLSL